MRSARPAGRRRLRLDALEDRLAPAAFRLGSTGADVAHSVVADAAGNVYVAGSFNGIVDFDPGAGTFNLTNANSTADAFVAKYTAAGALLWAGQIVDSAATDLALDAAGALHVTGNFSGTTDFDLGAGVFNLITGPANAAYVVRYNPNGSLGWARALGGQTSHVSGDNIAVDAAGNVYSSGVLSNGNADMDPGAGTSLLTNISGNANSYISKLDAAGNFVWARQFENLSTIAAGVWTAGLAVDAGQNVYLTGVFVGTVDFDPGPGTNWVSTFDTTFPSGDGYVARLTAAGNLSYVVRMGSFNGRDDGNDIAVDSAGNAFVAGFFTNTVRIDDTTATDTTLTSAGSTDILAMRLTPTGAVNWARRIGSTGGDVARGIHFDGTNDLYLTGEFVGTVDFDPGTGTRNLTSAGSNDVFGLRLQTDSTFMNAWSMGGSNLDYGWDIALTSTDHVAIVGQFQGTSDYDPGPGTNNLTSAGNYDAFVTVFSQIANRAPDAVDGTLTTNEDTPATGTLVAIDPDGDGLTYSLVSTANAHGTVTITNAATGAYSYTPDANYNGPASFTFKANDGSLDSNIATVSITVQAVNDAPVANNNAYSTDEDVILNISAPGVLGNDTDVENNTLSAIVVAGPANGLLTLNPNGSFSYRPRFDFNGTDTFTYKARDSAGAESNTATVTITVNAVNDAPRPTPIITRVTTNEDTAISGQLAAVDPEGDAFTFSSPPEFAPEHGTVTVSSTGAWTYTPNANYYGPDIFGYRVTDVHGASSVGAVEITVKPINDAPTAAADTYSVDEDGSLVISADPISRLRMISDPGDFIGQGLIWDFNPTTAAFSARTNFDNGVEVLVDPPGVVEQWRMNFAAPGEVALTPGEFLGATRWPFQAATEPGLDVSGYGRGLNRLRGEFTVYDVAYGASGAITRFAASFVQQDHNFDDTLEPPLYGAIVFNSRFGAAGGVLANDTDVEGELLLGATLVAGPANGTLAFNGDGTFTYTPNPNFHGTDTFTYRTGDARDNSNVATVTITVNAVNDAPVANNGNAATDEDTPLNGTVSATDVDGDALTYHLVAGPAHGTVVVNTNGTYTYTPSLNYNGSDSFTFKANDGSLDSNVATMSITVRAVNDSPVAGDDLAATDEDTAVTIAVLSNDTDVDGDVLSTVLVSGPSHGTAVVNGDGTVTYTPAANYNGLDTFTYKASDGVLQSGVATVTITVRAVNDAPVANDGSGSTNEDTTLNGTLTATDIDGDPLTFGQVAGPAHGTVTINADGTFTYTPVLNYHGSDSFTFKVNDGQADSNIATFSITVRPVNDAPVAVADSGATDEDTAMTIAVLSNDTDVDGDVLSTVLVSGPSHGTAVVNGDGTVTYTPSGNYNGEDTFTYKANDGSLDSNVVTVTITVRAVNDAPVANNDSYTATTNIPLNVPAAGVLGNDTDVDGNPLAAVLVSGPANGTLTLNGDGSFLYTPNSDFTGVDTFTYRANDGSLDSGTATVTIRVEPAGNTIGKVTGGGRVDGNRRRFKLDIHSQARKAGGFNFTGSLTFVDPVSQLRLRSTAIQSFRVDDTGTRAVITGTARVNGQAGFTFTVIVADLGQPGVGLDTFRILISGPGGFAYDSLDGSTTGELLTRGNIRVHRKP